MLKANIRNDSWMFVVLGLLLRWETFCMILIRAENFTKWEYEYLISNTVWGKESCEKWQKTVYSDRGSWTNYCSHIFKMLATNDLAFVVYRNFKVFRLCTNICEVFLLFPKVTFLTPKASYMFPMFENPLSDLF